MASAQPLTFAQLLKRHRLAAGLTQEALAERAGLAVRSISDLERGLRHSPYANTLSKLADALQLPAAEGAHLQAAARRGGIPQPRTADAPEGGRRTTLDARPHNLPVQPTPLLGREEAVRQVAATLRRADARLVTLTGPGGIGKTRLAIQVAADLLDDFADGVWFVGLSRLTDPSLVLSTVAQTLGVPEQGGRPLVETLRAHLRNKQQLLLLDNFEQVVVAAGEVGALFGSASNLKLLVTSRVPLRLRGEKRFPVPPLALAQPQPAPSPEHLMRYAAVALFVERAAEARPDFAVTAANAPAVAEICARLDGLPLAIELAAARVAVLSPEALLARLTGRLKLLTGGARDLEERQQTMRATLAWSEDLLSAQERTLFRRLSVFVGGCTLEAAEAVCAAPEGTEPLEMDLLDGLGTLVEQSLVQRREEGGEARFGMLHVIREFAFEGLAASGEAATLSQAHLAYYLALGDQFLRAENATWSTQAMQGWFDRIEREHDNVRAALAWARARAAGAHQASGAPAGAALALEAGLRLAGSLHWFQSTHGHVAEGREWLEGFLTLDAPDAGADLGEATTSDDREALTVRARALYGAGHLAVWQGDYDKAVPALQRSLALYRALGDHHLTDPLRNLAIVARGQGDLARATALFEEEVLLSREANNPFGAMFSLTDLGELALAAGDLDLAQARSEEALTLGLQAGEFHTQARNLILQALVACRRGLLERAAALARKAMELLWASGQVVFAAHGLEVCAFVQAARGRAEPAARLLGAAAAQRERLGMPRLMGDVPTPEDIEASVAAARAALGEEAWAAAFATGHALPLEQAVTEALQVSPQAVALPPVDFSTIVNRRK